MTRKLLPVALVFLLVGVIAGCKREASLEGDQTATMTPATPPASTESDADAPLTQTMEIGEERSPNEGGVLADGTPAGTTTGTVRGDMSSTSPSATLPSPNAVPNTTGTQRPPSE